MQCFICNSKTGPYQKLEVARLRFIRKRHKNFKDDSVLCARCFRSFEKIYQMKSKLLRKQRDSQSQSISNSHLSVVSSSSHSSGSKSVSTIAKSSDGNNNTAGDDDAANDSPDLVLQFDSRSVDSSVDSTDRIVQMVPDFISLRDSSRKTTKNPELNAARVGADAAMRSVVRRQTTIREESTLPDSTPVAPQRGNRLAVADAETSEDEDLAVHLSPDDLAHTRPIVRRRKQPVVQQFDDVMDLYIASTSGG